VAWLYLEIGLIKPTALNFNIARTHMAKLNPDPSVHEEQVKRPKCPSIYLDTISGGL
jgi:hypothetical protein